MMKISMGYPETPADEADIVRRMVNGEPLKKLGPVSTREELISIKEEIKTVTVHHDVMAYAVEIARNTRKSRYLSWVQAPEPPLPWCGLPKAVPIWRGACIPRLKILRLWRLRCSCTG